MKNLIAAISLALLATAANANCTLYSSHPKKFSSVLNEKGWTLKNYDVICEKMKAAGAMFVISAHATVLGGRSVAWASVQVADRATNVVNVNTTQNATRTAPEASQDVAERLMGEAIFSAVDAWAAEIDSGLSELAAIKRSSFVKTVMVSGRGA